MRGLLLLATFQSRDLPHNVVAAGPKAPRPPFMRVRPQVFGTPTDWPLKQEAFLKNILSKRHSRNFALRINTELFFNSVQTADTPSQSDILHLVRLGLLSPLKLQLCCHFHILPHLYDMAFPIVPARKVSVLTLKWQYYDDDVQGASFSQRQVDATMEMPISKGTFSVFHGNRPVTFLVSLPFRW